MRFSSKRLDSTSGLYYYGYRFYDPNTQRWMNRDPIEESGGVNLYQFVGNQAGNAFDSFGLQIGKFDCSAILRRAAAKFAEAAAITGTDYDSEIAKVALEAEAQRLMDIYFRFCNRPKSPPSQSWKILPEPPPNLSWNRNRFDAISIQPGWRPDFRWQVIIIGGVAIVVIVAIAPKPIPI